jgi:hypothetical protein
MKEFKFGKHPGKLPQNFLDVWLNSMNQWSKQSQPNDFKNWL